MRHRIAPVLRAGHDLLRILAPAPAGRFRILLFHDVVAGERESFAALVGRLVSERRLLTPTEAQSLLDGGAWDGGRDPCLLSFDDGFAGNLDLARTVLARFDAKALFFVCPGLMEIAPDAQGQAIAHGIHDGKRPDQGLRLMDWDGLEQLAAAGHVIGNHTATHRRLSRLSPGQRADEIGQAALVLSRRLGPAAWFAYPFGDIDSIDAASLAEIGRHHRWCRSGVRGANAATTHPLALRADHVELAGPPAWRDLAADGGLDPFYRKQRIRLDRLAAVA